MLGNDFLDTLRAVLAPISISSTRNNSTDPKGGIELTLSDGRTIQAKRKRIKDCADQAELDAYVQEILA